MIDTKEKRRAVIDFGKGPRGTGMPVPSGSFDESSRGHILNLYPGILPPKESFFFWRNRRIQSSGWLGRMIQASAWKNRNIQTSDWKANVGQTSSWQKPTDADDGGWVEPNSTKDS